MVSNIHIGIVGVARHNSTDQIQRRKMKTKVKNEHKRINP